MHLQIVVGLFAICVAGNWRISIEKYVERCFHCLVSYAQTSPPVVAVSVSSPPAGTTLIGVVSSKILSNKSDHLN